MGISLEMDKNQYILKSLIKESWLHLFQKSILLNLLTKFKLINKWGTHHDLRQVEKLWMLKRINQWLISYQVKSIKVIRPMKLSKLIAMKLHKLIRNRKIINNGTRVMLSPSIAKKPIMNNQNFHSLWYQRKAIVSLILIIRTKSTRMIKWY